MHILDYLNSQPWTIIGISSRFKAESSEWLRQNVVQFNLKGISDKMNLVDSFKRQASLKLAKRKWILQ